MTDLTYDDAVNAGFDAHQCGDFAEAADLYAAALSLNPENPAALKMYGSSLARAGRIEEAEAPLQKAIENGPAQPGFYVDLSNYLVSVGESDLAVGLLTPITRRWPEYVAAWVQLGEAHIAKSEFRLAADALDEALRRDPTNYQLAIRLASALGDVGDYQGVEYVLGHAEQLQPQGLPATRVHVMVSKKRRQWNFVGLGAKRLVEANPQDVGAWRDLAIAYYETGRRVLAAETFERVLELEGSTPDNLAVQARLWIDAGRPEQAREALATAEKADPEHVETLAAKAVLLISEGDFERAARTTERAIELSPDYAPAYPQLSALKRGKLDEKNVAFLAQISSSTDRSPQSRSTVSFVLAHHYDATGEIDSAFSEYENANRLARGIRREEEIVYNPERAAEWNQRVRDKFSAPQSISTLSLPNDAGKPIFIVGAPWSGALLAESMLGAHSKVTPGGELPMLNGLFEMVIATDMNIEEEQAELLETYFGGAPAAPGGYFTDRNLFNLRAAGLIGALMPEAQIIHVQRNAIEAGLSIFRHEFVKFWPFTDDLENIGHYLGENARFAAHWKQVLGDRFHTMQYEALVDNYETEARNLAAACGLDWEAACGDPASVTAVNSLQAREEKEERSGRAAAYEKYLGPLRASLEAAGVDLETGALKV